MNLESERLYFERLNESHFESFCIGEMDPEVMKYVRKASATKDEARVVFERYLHYMAGQTHLGAWAIFLKETKKQIGFAVLYHQGMDAKNEKFEIGYRFHQDFWGKGFGTETNYCVLDFAFNQLNLPMVWGLMRPQNLNSKKIVLKMGYTDHGISMTSRGETQTFSISKEQYETL